MSLLPRVKFSVNTNYADSVAPTVSSVSTSVSDGTYALGAVIPIIVNLNKAVYVTTTGGTPQITIETGGVDRVVPYSSGSGTSALTFNYTVQSGDESPDLDYVGTGSLVLNGGLILSGTGVAATLTLPAPGAAGSLSNGRAIVVDGAVPTYISSDIPAGGLTLVDTYSSPIVFGLGGSGGRTITLSGGATTLSSPVIAGSTITWTFSRTVGGGETCSANAYTQPGNGIEDAAGNDLATFTGRQGDVTNNAGGATYDLISENAEGSGTPTTPVVWTDTGGSVNWDYTTTVLEGAHSVRISAGSSTSAPIGSRTEAHGYCLLQFTSLPATTASVFGFRAADTSPRALFRVNPTGNVAVYTQSGTPGDSAFTTDALAINTTYHIWVTWLASGLCTAAFSTDGIKPTSGTAKFVSRTGGTGVASVLNAAGSSLTVDKFRASTTPIGDNPA